VVGSGGSILKTSDGGNTWVKQISGTNVTLESVHFLNNQVGVVVGLNGTILKTKDGGTNWYAQTSNSINHFSDVHFFDANMGCAVGSNRNIRTTTTVGEWPSSVQEFDKNNELDFKLYPNPAADNLSILSQEKISSIKLSNSLGAVVLKQKFNSKRGTINTGQLASGTYYITVSSKDKTKSQKISVR